MSISGRNLSCNIDSVAPFIKIFEDTVNELSGLFWRILPQKTFVYRAKKSAPGRKLTKDRITFMA